MVERLVHLHLCYVHMYNISYYDSSGLLALSPDHSHISACNIENVGVAWGRGYRLIA